MLNIHPESVSIVLRSNGGTNLVFYLLTKSVVYPSLVASLPVFSLHKVYLEPLSS